jgi:hypothetical protein
MLMDVLNLLRLSLNADRHVGALPVTLGHDELRKAERWLSVRTIQMWHATHVATTQSHHGSDQRSWDAAKERNAAPSKRMTDVIADVALESRSTGAPVVCHTRCMGLAAQSVMSRRCWASQLKQDGW